MNHDTEFLPGDTIILRGESALEFLAGREPSEIEYYDGAPCQCRWGTNHDGLVFTFVLRLGRENKVIDMKTGKIID